LGGATLQSGEVKVRAEKTTITTKLESKRAPTSLLYGSFVAAKKDGEDDDGMYMYCHGYNYIDGRHVVLRWGGRNAIEKYHAGAVQCTRCWPCAPVAIALDCFV
jgi:hypothetical protein